jgi:hypothetical protein
LTYRGVARAGTNVDGLFYQNDVESLHAQEKRIQGFKAGDVLTAVKTVELLARREEREEMVALYGSSQYVIAPQYKQFLAPSWHSWSDDRKQKHLQDFLTYDPTLEDTFPKPANAGQKPGFSRRNRTTVAPTIIVDRHDMSAESASPATSGESSSGSSSTSSSSGSSSASSTGLAAPAPPSVEDELPFEDPREDVIKPYTLLLKEVEAKTVIRCYGCQDPIHAGHKLLVRSSGMCTWHEKGKPMSRYGRQYLHFSQKCLKGHDSENYYGPGELFPWSRIKISPKSKAKMSGPYITSLKNTFGIE